MSSRIARGHFIDKHRDRERRHRLAHRGAHGRYAPPQPNGQQMNNDLIPVSLRAYAAMDHNNAPGVHAVLAGWKLIRCSGRWAAHHQIVTARQSFKRLQQAIYV